MTTDYLWDEFSRYGDVVQASNLAETTSFTLANGTLISQAIDDGVNPSVTSYFLTDAIGSTRALTDDTGTVSSTYEYNAFGELLGEPDVQSLGTDYLYAGQQFDPMTELYSMRARYYDASVGRFMSRDTWAYDYENPVELNRYTYARQNPVMFTDPSGNTSSRYGQSLTLSTSQAAIIARTAINIGIVSAVTVASFVIFMNCQNNFHCNFDWREQILALAQSQGRGEIQDEILDAAENLLQNNDEAKKRLRSQIVPFPWITSGDTTSETPNENDEKIDVALGSNVHPVTGQPILTMFTANLNSPEIASRFGVTRRVVWWNEEGFRTEFGISFPIDINGPADVQLFQNLFLNLVAHDKLGTFHINLEGLDNKFDLDTLEDDDDQDANDFIWEIPDYIGEAGGLDAERLQSATAFELFTIQNNVALCTSERVQFYTDGSDPSLISRPEGFLDDFCG